MLLTTKATKEIAKRYGGLSNLGEKLMKSENFELALDEIVWLITLPANQSVLVYNLQNKDKNEAVYDISAATRADTYAEQNLPDEWLNDVLFSYLGFMSIEGDTVSNSVCLPPDLPVFPKNR